MTHKKILYILDDFHIGGITSTIKEYVRSVTSQGGEAIILGMQGNLRNPESYFSEAKCIIVPTYPSKTMNGRMRQTYIFLKYLSQTLRTQNVKNIHFSNVWSTLYCLFLPSVWRLNKISTTHGFYALEKKSQQQNNLLSEKLKYYIRLHTQGIQLLVSDKIVTFSTYAAQCIKELFPYVKNKQIIIIPGTTPNTFIYNKYVPKKGRQTLNLLAYGRAEPRKGFQLLLNALSLLRNRSIPAELTIASPVEYYRWFPLLETYQSLNLLRSMRFLHALDESQKQIELNRSDLVIVPSAELETFGIIIVESFSRGVPVIGTPVGAIPELLGKVDKRLVAQDISAQGLANTIEWFYTLPRSKKKIISDRCIRVVKDNYTTEKYIQNIMRLYR